MIEFGQKIGILKKSKKLLVEYIQKNCYTIKK